MGYIVGGGELRIDPSKVEVIVNWPKTNNVTDVRIFLGVAQYWRKFIVKFSFIACPLHALTGVNNISMGRKITKILQHSERKDQHNSITCATRSTTTI